MDHQPHLNHQLSFSAHFGSLTPAGTFLPLFADMMPVPNRKPVLKICTSVTLENCWATSLNSSVTDRCNQWILFEFLRLLLGTLHHNTFSGPSKCGLVEPVRLQLRCAYILQLNWIQKVWKKSQIQIRHIQDKIVLISQTDLAADCFASDSIHAESVEGLIRRLLLLLVKHQL